MKGSAQALAVAIVLFAWPGAARANLIANGSFEESSVHPANWVTLYTGSTDITGWVVSRDNIDLTGGYWAASDGSQSLDLDGTFAFGAISQLFATVPAQVYQVAFAMAGNPDACGIRHMRVSAAGSYGDFEFNSCGQTSADMGWSSKHWQFSATTTNTTLEFSSLGSTEAGDTGAYGPALDNVVVTLVSEPSTWALLGAGLYLPRRSRRSRRARRLTSGCS